uniref:Uncharacterized protein n=1 Tax=Rhizophora mucronata TaxID=61149 RepID=A0A2P2NW53_RHIMU
MTTTAKASLKTAAPT